MSFYYGKGATQFIDGACAGLGGAGLLASALRIASNVHPVAKGVYWGAVAGCAGWAIYRLSQSVNWLF